MAAENLGLQESDFTELSPEQFSFGDSRGTKRPGEDANNGMAAMFGDDGYDFWNQIANSTELPWSVVYPDDPQDAPFM
jgi:hypothetical protein